MDTVCFFSYSTHHSVRTAILDHCYTLNASESNSRNSMRLNTLWCNSMQLAQLNKTHATLRHLGCSWLVYYCCLYRCQDTNTMITITMTSNEQISSVVIWIIMIIPMSMIIIIIIMLMIINIPTIIKKKEMITLYMTKSVNGSSSGPSFHWEYCCCCFCWWLWSSWSHSKWSVYGTYDQISVWFII